MRIARAPLTEKQENIYKFIVNYMRKYKYAPTIREIQRNFKYKAANTVVHFLTALRNKGYITMPDERTASSSSRARTIRLVDDILGNHYIKPHNLGTALKKLKERGYSIDANESIELLKELNIFVE